MPLNVKIAHNKGRILAQNVSCFYLLDQKQLCKFSLKCVSNFFFRNLAEIQTQAKQHLLASVGLPR